ncbi:hypothetical protein HDU67_009234 [Dinochytrium kinnereticum]|nr:hypothetical protein HDU67_009234 [Dinochytrium kinnereticum]
MAEEAITDANDSYLAKKIAVPRKPKHECTSQFVAGGDTDKSGGRTEIAAIFGTFCRHKISGAVWDMDVGEKYKYAVAAIQDLHARHSNRKLAVSYDIACKLDTHMKNYDIERPYIMMLPKLHAYCYDHACQSRFSPKVLMGLGHFDGEGCERCWSLFSKIIGLTQHQTFGNRRLTISLAIDSADMKKSASSPRLIARLLDEVLKRLQLLAQKKIPETIEEGNLTYKGVVELNRINRHAMDDNDLKAPGD